MREQNEERKEWDDTSEFEDVGFVPSGVCVETIVDGKIDAGDVSWVMKRKKEETKCTKGLSRVGALFLVKCQSWRSWSRVGVHILVRYQIFEISYESVNNEAWFCTTMREEILF